MRRQVVIAIALAAMIALAGCSGILGDGNQTTTPEETTTEAPETVNYPDGFNETGVTNTTEATKNHLNGFEDAGSWHVVYDAEFNQEGQDAVTVRETRTVEVTENETQELTTVDAPNAQQEMFANATHTYRMMTQENQSFYSFQKQGMNTARSTYSDMFVSFLGSIDYEQQSTSEQDGQTFITYEGVELTEDNQLEQGNQTVENLQSTLVVDEEGLIHEFTFEGDVVQDDGTNQVSFSVTFSDVGSATVDEPAWLDEAKNDTAPPEE